MVVRYVRRLVRWSLVLLCVGMAPAWAQPGSVIDLEARGTFSAAAVRDQTAGRFSNNGGQALPVRSAVQSFVLRFETRDAFGAPIEAVAHLFVPDEPHDAGMLLAFAPGSTGLVDACAPSRPYVNGGALETYGAYGLAYAGQGLPTVVPNYTGFFNPDVLQPYFVAEAEAFLVLDSLRAADAALRSLQAELGASHAFAAGFSQGGHAVFAAADRHADLAPDVPLSGVLGFGPSGEVDVVMRAFPFVAPWILVAYAEVYGDAITPAALLQEPFASRLARDVDQLCIAEVQAQYPGDPAALLEANLAASLVAGTLSETHAALAALVELNRTGTVAHGLPVAIFQGVDDPVAPIGDQDRFVAGLCDLGSPVRYATYLRTRHETRYIGFDEALAWMRAVRSGEPAPTDCDALSRP